MNTVYVGSLSKSKLDAVDCVLGKILQDYTIEGVKITTPIRSSPSSGQETIAGSKLRALELSKLYPNSWCVGIETGLISFNNFTDPTLIHNTNIPHEVEDNPEAFLYVTKFKTEGNYQKNLDIMCKESYINSNICDLSSTNTFNVTATTVISPNKKSITYLSSSYPMPFYPSEMKIYDDIYHELEKEKMDDFEKIMSINKSNRTKSIIDPLTKCFDYLLHIPISKDRIKQFWTKDRISRYFKDYDFEPIPNFDDVDNLAVKYWIFLV